MASVPVSVKLPPAAITALDELCTLSGQRRGQVIAEAISLLSTAVERPLHIEVLRDFITKEYHRGA